MPVTSNMQGKIGAEFFNLPRSPEEEIPLGCTLMPWTALLQTFREIKKTFWQNKNKKRPFQIKWLTGLKTLDSPAVMFFYLATLKQGRRCSVPFPQPWSLCKGTCRLEVQSYPKGNVFFKHTTTNDKPNQGPKSVVLFRLSKLKVTSKFLKAIFLWNILFSSSLTPCFEWWIYGSLPDVPVLRHRPTRFEILSPPGTEFARKGETAN